VDSKGKQIPDFLKLLAVHLCDERKYLREELNGLHAKVEHIKSIITHPAIVCGRVPG